MTTFFKKVLEKTVYWEGALKALSTLTHLRLKWSVLPKDTAVRSLSWSGDLPIIAQKLRPLHHCHFLSQKMLLKQEKAKKCNSVAAKCDTFLVNSFVWTWLEPKRLRQWRFVNFMNNHCKFLPMTRKAWTILHHIIIKPLVRRVSALWRGLKRSDTWRSGPPFSVFGKTLFLFWSREQFVWILCKCYWR